MKILFKSARQIPSKFTITGSPNGDKCNQDYLIEGPGLRAWFTDEGYVDGKWTTRPVTNDCLSLDGNPLRVYTTRDLTHYHEGTPIDGVVKNVSFTNTATETTIINQCSEENVGTTLSSITTTLTSTTATTTTNG